MDIKNYLTEDAYKDIFKKIGIQYKGKTINKVSIIWDKHFPEEEPSLIVEYQYKTGNKTFNDGFCTKMFSELKW